MAEVSMEENEERSAAKKSSWMRWAPLIALVGAAVAAFFFLGELLSLDNLAANRAALIEWRDANYAVALLVFAAAYVAVVALSIPGALPMTLGGGFLFGLWPGAVVIILAATTGAMIIFLIARSSLGAAMRERAGPWMKRFERGFNENSASYLLIMRLTPVVPFFIANVAPALLGVKARVFFWTTLLGIAPGTAVYTWVGSGLGEALDSGEAVEGDIAGVILQPQFLAPLIGLALLSALPIIIKALRARGKGDA